MTMSAMNRPTWRNWPLKYDMVLRTMPSRAGAAVLAVLVAAYFVPLPSIEVVREWSDSVGSWFVALFFAAYRDVAGADEVEAPVYSHLVYDRLPGERIVVKHPDIVLVEGLNVLQPARLSEDGRTRLAVSDFFDFTVYVDAETADVRRWYVNRFLQLRKTAFRDPASYFARYARLSHDEAVTEAGMIWDTINGPNLEENIKPTRARATLVLRKDADHSVRWVRLRKL